MSRGVSVSVVIPAFNESAVLPSTLAALRDVDLISEIIVVDDGSTDATSQSAHGPRTRVLGLLRNEGKGAALQYGVDRARGQIVVLLDADLGASAGQTPALIAPVQDDRADLVIGAFGSGRPAGFGLVQAVARQGIRLLGGVTMTCPLSGQRAFHRRVLRAAPRFASGFGAEVAFTIDAVRAGFRILEVPVEMSHNETGRDIAGFVHRGKQLWHVGQALWTRSLRPGRPVVNASGREGDDS